MQSTGIWKSVWLEHVSEARVETVKMTPDIDRHMIRLDFQLNGIEGRNNLRLETKIELKGQHVQTISLSPDRPWMTVEASVKHEAGGPWKQSLWSPDSPNLYDIEFVLYENEKEIDRCIPISACEKYRLKMGRFC